MLSRTFTSTVESIWRERVLRLIFPAALLVVLIASVMAWSREGEATIRIRIVDAATGDRTPARVKLTHERGGAAPTPVEAIGVMYGMWDHADGFARQPDSSFYVAGYFEQKLEPGRYVLSISKGHEYVAVQDTLEVGSSDVSRTYRLERWIDTAEMGWFSSDGHIHIRRSPREDPLLLDWIRAEDIRVGNLLRMGDFWAKYYSQYAFGSPGAYREGNHMLLAGQEDPRTPELGHVVGLGASAFVRFPRQYYLYDLVFDSLRALGGVGGFAHQAETFHGYRGLTLDGLRGKVDVLEVVQFCAPGGPLIVEHYYHLLNLGFPVTATAGSDFPWCGEPHDGTGEIPFHPAARIGNARFYVYVDDSLSYDSWMEALRAGRTFASSGPVLFLEVNGAKPGSTVDVSAGATVEVRVSARGHTSQIPLKRIEIIGHGDVLAVGSAGDEGQSRERIEMTLELPVGDGIWIAARAEAGAMQVAHTTPVYVTVNGGGFENVATLDSLLLRSEQYLSDLEHVLRHPHEHVEQQAWRYADELRERIGATREVIDHMRGP